MNNQSGFRLIKTVPNTKARAGELVTPHGTVSTPAFMPVGSQGTVKALTPDEIRETGFSMVLSNTYHLYLRPGMDVIEKAGGLHNFMGWHGAILTDSGGFQVFSLARLRKVSDEGVIFRSHIDGSEHILTPELAIKYQEILGSDIAMVLDECASHGDMEKARKAMERTHLWAEKCLKAHKRKDQYVYAIVQGGVFPELRQQSAEYLTSLDFPGYAIGGLSIGEAKTITLEMLEKTVPFLPEKKPRYLMGVGSPEDIFEGVTRGIDIFDSVLPTRVARNGSLFTRSGRINIRNAGFARRFEPVESDCHCYTCRNFPAAYLHHLFNAKELLAYRLATIHNLAFMSRLMEEIRESILGDTFSPLKERFLSGYKPTDEQVRLSQKEKWLKAQDFKEQNPPYSDSSFRPGY
jgi:queuine tRNA-ribosyltransferase